MHTQSDEARGLSGYKHLEANEGMLFLYSGKKKQPSFWMKGMAFPLDLIWIKDHKIVQINHVVMPPKPGEKDAHLPRYTSKMPVDAVLEIRGGQANKDSLQVGDAVNY